MYWKEQRKLVFGGAGDSTYLTVPLWLSLARPSFPETLMTSSGKQESKQVDDTGSCDCGPKCVGLDCDSTSGNAEVYHASSSSHQRFLHTVLRRRRLRTAGHRRHRQSACRQASGRLLPKTLTTLLLAFGQLTARCVSAWKTPSRVVAKMTATGSMQGVCNCAARRAGGTRCLPTSIQTGSRTKASPATISSLPVRLCGVIIGTTGRQTGCSFFPGIHDSFGVWTQVCWQAISMARGMLSACREVRTFVTTSRCRTIHALSPSTIALWSSTRTSSRTATRVCRSSTNASSNIPRGLSRAWLPLASSAELPTGRTLSSRSPTFT